MLLLQLRVFGFGLFVGWMGFLFQGAGKRCAYRQTELW